MPSDASLRAVYRELPRLECKGLCLEFCGPVPTSPAERSRIHRAAGRRVITGADAVCPYLSEQGRCTVYSIRPLMCRLWGMAEGMECPHGCKPDRPLSREDALKLATTLGVKNDHLLAELRGDAIEGYQAKLRRGGR
ncbi:MAG: YkgJ family cysteine cluster protein [Dehalococcoidia bacterium]